MPPSSGIEILSLVSSLGPVRTYTAWKWTHIIPHTPQNTASAFACVSFNNGMSGAIAYYVFAGTSRTATCSIVFAFGLLGIICYLLSVRTHSHRLVSKEYDSLPRKSDV